MEDPQDIPFDDMITWRLTNLKFNCTVLYEITFYVIFFKSLRVLIGEITLITISLNLKVAQLAKSMI